MQSPRLLASKSALAGAGIMLAGAWLVSSWAAGHYAYLSDGRIFGVICGPVLAAVVFYALAQIVTPVVREENSGFGWALLALLVLFLIKLLALNFFHGLGIDVGTYQAWAMHIRDVGPAKMYAPGYFIDYPPGYIYCLWAAATLANLVGATGESFRIVIESPALIADILLSLVIFAAIRRSSQPRLAWIAMFAFALNPGLLFDTVIWGQSDSVLALLLLVSVLLLIESRHALGWGVIAIALLVKPQAVMVLPVLWIWTLLTSDPDEWARSALAFAAVGLVAIRPFQIGHAWDWLFSLYSSTAGYYHETSVNAFNLMALLGGIRQQDTTPILGISALHLGMGLLVMLYGALAAMLWRKTDNQTLLFTVFAALFGFFMVAPRMHERYLYPAIVFLIPLALDSPLLAAVLCTVSITFLLNLAYIKHILEAGVFLAPYDGWAMAISAANLLAMLALVPHALAGISIEGPQTWLERKWRALPPLMNPVENDAENAEPDPSRSIFTLRWVRTDTVVLSVLVIFALATRFWRIWSPNEIVFDEVHFVTQARHYLHSEPFLDPHPPVAKLLIALGIKVFGDHPWSWRLPNAMLGTALVAITYLLARRMFTSRLVGAMAAAFVLCDGMFLVDSRIAVLDIVYLTFAACAYLWLFRFAQSPPGERRRELIPMALALGLCLGAKLLIPAVTFLLVMGFMIFILARSLPAVRVGKRSRVANPQRDRLIAGAVALVSGVAAMVYIASFLPHYLLGWWGGIEDLYNYYIQTIGYEQSVSSATHPYSAPWWSWPFMFRPIAYWQNFPATGNTVATIWGGGNPVLWWGAVSGISIAARMAFERRNMARAFLVIGYLAYLLMWIPIGRTLFLYHYMPAVYLGYIALAAILAETWEGKAELVDHAALLVTLLPVFFLGLGPVSGTLVFLAIMTGYLACLGKADYPGKFVCLSFLATALVVFIYYFPIWIGLPIARAGYYSRMWLQGPTWRNWI